MTTNLSFGQALDQLKKGKNISRKGWNSQGMFIYLNKGSHDFGEDIGLDIYGVSADLFINGAEGTSTRLPNINMKSATGSIVTGWLASQTDLLADDWCVLY
ncbi:MAG: DUF2829 domain-containing protein [Saprospiraceae bacterium]|nr:DUF2829 domain-containing protein [Saprospiraceae bacterium]MBP6567249.1 DUF2829 domain-containing protein [Saprospiraceae bacterium]